MWYSCTIMKPAAIYSYIVETLQSIRISGPAFSEPDWEGRPARNLNEHTFIAIHAECKSAVFRHNDIKDFRGTCEAILEKIIKMKKDIAFAESVGIHPVTKRRFVKKEIMLPNDECGKLDSQYVGFLVKEKFLEKE